MVVAVVMLIATRVQRVATIVLLYVVTIIEDIVSVLRDTGAWAAYAWGTQNVKIFLVR